MTNNQFDESFMRRLERLSLVTRRIRSGRTKGGRRSTKRGTSIEFADYRDYTPGDDLRHLDWRAYARLERPFIKLFEEEEDIPVHLVLDASGSMDWPQHSMALTANPNSSNEQLPLNEQNKWNFGCRLVAALGYLALAGGDRLTVTLLGEQAMKSWGPHRGRGQIHSLLNYLRQTQPQGLTDLNSRLHTLAQTHAQSGLLFLLSDFLSPQGYEQGLMALGGTGYECNILHLLSPDEIRPQLGGDLRLIDVETGLQQEMTIDGAMRRLYLQHFATWRAQLEQYCFAHDTNYALIETAQAFDNIIMGHLRQRGFLQ